jgi:hypothetical protein
VTLIRCVYVPTDQNPADLLTKSLEVAAFDRHRLALSGATAAAAANATHAGDSIGADVALEPLGVWEAYFAATSERVPDPTEGVAPADRAWSSMAAFIAESPAAPLLRVLAAVAPRSFSSDLFVTPFGAFDPTLLSAEPAPSSTTINRRFARRRLRRNALSGRMLATRSIRIFRPMTRSSTCRRTPCRVGTNSRGMHQR